MPGSSVKTMFGLRMTSLAGWSPAPSWTANPTEWPRPWMNRPLYFVASISVRAAASTDFPRAPGFIRANAAA